MIIFVGDCHGDFSEAVESIISYSSLGISGIIFLGDQTPEKTLEEELEDIGPDLIARTWFILGNHDSDYSKFVQNHAGIWSRHLHAKVIEFSGVHVAGLSGVFRRFAWYPPDEPKIERRDNSDINDIKYDANKAELTQHDALTRYTTIFPEDFKNLKRNKTDVIITHEAPSTHRHGFKEIDILANDMGAKLIIHGHHHEDYRARNGFGVEVFGIGLKQVLPFDKRMINQVLSE